MFSDRRLAPVESAADGALIPSAKAPKPIELDITGAAGGTAKATGNEAVNA